MTTVIGVQGRDPQTGENYVLIAADSQGSADNGLWDFDAKKLFATQGSNYALGTAGKILGDVLHRDECEAYDDLFATTSKDLPQLEDALNDMNGHIEAASPEPNQYLVGLENNGTPVLLRYAVGGFHACETYAAIGSGKEHVGALAKFDTHRQNGRVALEKRAALDILTQAMRDATKDTYTGGVMDAAILTAGNLVYLPAYTKLSSNTHTSVPEDFDGSSNCSPLYWFE